MSDAEQGQKVPMTTYERLAARFPASAHKTRKQGNRDLTYVDGELVISRLNEVLGFEWSFRVLREGATDIEAWVLGELSATIDGKLVTRQQYGNQDLARGQHPTADLYKSAATDALKKCATTIGIALYLFNQDERQEVEAEMREAKRAPRPLREQPAADRPGGSPTPSSNAGTSPEADPLQQRWQRLVAEAERVNLPTVGRVKAVDPTVLSTAQLKKYADQLEERLYEAKEASGAA